MSLIKSNKTGNVFPTLMSDFFDTDNFFSSKWFEREFEHSLPDVNIKENGKEFNIELAIPGMKKEDFKVAVENNVLTISAERKEEKNEKDERYTRREFSYSSFSRSFTLPGSVNGDKIDAKYTDGILHLTIPKKEEAKALSKKEIKVG